MTWQSSNQACPVWGFSVSQPALGCPLEFFPAMGSQELDDMINAYVVGPDSIMDKRAMVSVEFFTHNLQTGELFKFFPVYENASSTTSPASSSGMIDSGYGSSFNASPVLSESQWSQSTSSSSSKARKSSKAASSVSRPQDFSHIPGFSIMTKDGQDVTHSASRGMKTKEQRDHAHLMRVIKACESCRKKKTRCDPSHKKRTSVASAASESSARASKKSNKTASRTVTSIASAKAQSMLAPSQSAPAMAADSLLFDLTGFADEATAESWEQFVQYDESVAATAATVAAPNDWEHFFDTAGYYSPSSSHTNSTPMSPSRAIQAPPTGLQPVDGGVRDPGFSQEPMVPYLNPGALGNAGSNYVDFNLYSPGSTCLDDDPAFIQDVAAPWHDYAALLLSQRHSSIGHQPESIGSLQSAALFSQRHSSIDHQPESIGTQQSPASLSQSQPSIDRQPESIGTPQSLASRSQRHPESIDTLQPLANSNALEAFAKNSAPGWERRSRSQDHAPADLHASADRRMSPQRDVDHIIDGGDMFHKSESQASERQPPVLVKQHNSGAVSVGVGMPSPQMAAAAHEPYGRHGANGSSAPHGLHIGGVRDDSRSHNNTQEVDVQHHRQDSVQERRQCSSVDSGASTSGDLGTQTPKPSPAVERARSAPELRKLSSQGRPCPDGKHCGDSTTCSQSMAALVQGAAILAMMATFVGQLASWWPQRESKGSWKNTSSHALPPVASPSSSEQASFLCGTEKDTSSVSQLRQAAALFQKRRKGWTGNMAHRMPLAVMG
jgi:hypothetical protein